jgi:hypothetical protein
LVRNILEGESNPDAVRRGGAPVGVEFHGCYLIRVRVIGRGEGLSKPRSRCESRSDSCIELALA